MRRRLPPLHLKTMLRDRNGLLTRLELAFALEPVHKLKPVVQRKEKAAEKDPER